MGGTQKSTISNLIDDKRFEQQALKSGISHMDTQKLLELVKKYGNGTNYLQNSYLKATSDNANSTLKSNSLNLPALHFKDEQQDYSQRSDLAPQNQQFYEKVQKTQEERNKRVQELKKKLNDDQSMISGNPPNYFQDDQSQIQLEEDEDYPEKEKQKMLEIINKIVERQEDYEAMQREIENQNQSRDLIKPQEDAFNVYNRLYSYAKNKQNQDQSMNQKSNYSDNKKNAEPNSQVSDNLKLQEQIDGMQEIKRKPGVQLYQEFLERQQRFKAVQESQKHKIEQEQVKSKVNYKSHQLAYKKLEKDLDQALQYVDYDNSKYLSLTQIGQFLGFIGIFKYLYNEQQSSQINNKSQYNLELNSAQIKIEERKLREEEFLIQFWLKINPSNEEQVESNIVQQFIKIIYDPYQKGIESQKQQEKLIQEYAKAIRNLNGLPHEEDIIIEQENENTSIEQSAKKGNSQGILWTASDLMKALRMLTDNFCSFKSATGSAIKIPNIKNRKAYYDSYKECTFKPQINRKSEILEKYHWAHFFQKQHNQSIVQNPSSQMAGKIVNKIELSKKSININTEESQNSNRAAGVQYSLEDHSLQDENISLKVQMISQNPAQMLLVDPQHRVELLLEKERIKQEKIKQMQRQEQQKQLNQCTFQPNASKRQNHQGQSKQSTQNGQQVHQRLWEISKVKQMQQPAPTFDEKLEVLQECTFKPNISKNAKCTRRTNQEEFFIKGYDETIMRLKKGKMIQDNKKQQFENLGKPKILVAGTQTQVKPFQFETGKNKHSSNQNKSQKALIDVEITVATGKVVHLTIKEGEDVSKVARNFCKTYSLNEATRQRLEDQLLEYLEDKDQNVTQLNRETPNLPVIENNYEVGNNSPFNNREFDVYHINESQQEEDEEEEQQINYKHQNNSKPYHNQLENDEENFNIENEEDDHDTVQTQIDYN